MTMVSKFEIVVFVVILVYIVYLLFSFNIIGKKD